MKVKKRRLAGILAIISILVFVLGGCTIKTPGDGTVVRIEKNFEAGQLFYLEEELCTTTEARIFLMNQKNLYSSRYGEEIWNSTYEGEPLYSYLEDNLKDFLVRLKCMVLMAGANEISLSADDNRLIALASNTYYKSLSEAELAYCDATLEDITEAYSDYFLANKLFRVLTQDATKEISDDEARVITVQMIYLPFDKIIIDNGEKTDSAFGDASDQQTPTDGSGESVDSTADSIEGDNSTQASEGDASGQTSETTETATETEPQTTNEQLINELHRRATMDQEDFFTLAESYSEGPWTEKQICRGEMEEAFETAAFALSSGAISKVVTGKDGYYIIKCLNNHEVEQTKAHREKLIEEWKQEIFKEKYDAFVTNLYLRFNDLEWISIDFSASTPEYNDSFYSIYDEFLSGSE